MRIKLLILALAMTIQLAVAQHLRLHSATDGVTVLSGGKKTAATPGMTLKPVDALLIPEGGWAEVLNTSDNRIYKSVRFGQISVTKLIIEARQSATSKIDNLGSKLNLSKSTSASGKRIYKEQGVVNRSLCVYDPEAGAVEMDIESLARYVASRLSGDTVEPTPEGLALDISEAGDKGCSVRVANSGTTPVYFNILSFASEPRPRVEISSIGQPDGCYVLLASQTMAREQLTPLTNDRHFIVMTPCTFELDRLIEEVNRLLAEPGAEAGADDQLPVFMRTF